MKTTLFFILLFLSLAVAAVVDTRTINVQQIAKIRCSLNVEDETFFFFNGSVIAYLTGSAPENKYLFKTVGINVGRCFKVAENVYTLASRELLYYIDPFSDQIINSWSNPWTGEVLTVAHVDNDPVLQTFNNTFAPVQVFGDQAFFNLDIPLLYPNPLANNVTFAPYSPQPLYQAGEFFKFIFPTANLDENVSTVDYALVSWTREGPFLPWMAMGNKTGHLIYSSSGARIPSWEYLPAQVVADLDNRIPHYKHAPLCVPATASVTSWSFFKNHYNDWLAGERFPLATAANYSCVPNTEIPNPTSSPSPSSSPSSSPSPSPSPSPSSNPINSTTTSPSQTVCPSGAFHISASLATCLAVFLAISFF